MTAHDPCPLAAILIRGPVHVDREVVDTLYYLRLRNKHTCVVLANSPTITGMLKRCSNYIAWGEISQETLQELKNRRTKTTISANGTPQPKPYFRLHPPRGGFERKGIKVPFTQGGSIGYRGQAINALIKKML